MGKTPVRMKAVVYALSPFQQKVMAGLWKDLPSKIHHKVSENWISATLLLTPLVGTYTALRALEPMNGRRIRFTVDDVRNVPFEILAVNKEGENEYVVSGNTQNKEKTVRF